MWPLRLLSRCASHLAPTCVVRCPLRHPAESTSRLPPSTREGTPTAGKDAASRIGPAGPLPATRQPSVCLGALTHMPAPVVMGITMGRRATTWARSLSRTCHVSFWIATLSNTTSAGVAAVLRWSCTIYHRFRGSVHHGVLRSVHAAAEHGRTLGPTPRRVVTSQVQALFARRPVRWVGLSVRWRSTSRSCWETGECVLCGVHTICHRTEGQGCEFC